MKIFSVRQIMRLYLFCSTIALGFAILYAAQALSAEPPERQKSSADGSTSVSINPAISKSAALEEARARIAEIEARIREEKASGGGGLEEIIPQIVGGTDSEPGARPYQVALLIPEFGLNCGGALLDRRWVMTAAHCIGAPYIVRAGSIQMSSGGTVLEVAHEIFNPAFDGITFDNDIALLRLAQDAPAELTPLLLPDADIMDAAANPGDMSTVSGWGRIFTGGPLSEILQEVDVPIISNEACDAAYAPLFGEGSVTDSMICAGFEEGGQDSCNGDSGGPMTVTVDGEDYSVGIVSWGSVECAATGLYGVYTRTVTQLEWLNAAMSVPEPELVPMELGVPITGLSGVASQQLLYTFELTEDSDSMLDIGISGGTGDADLYVYDGAGATLTSYVCRPWLLDNEENCTLLFPHAGTYTIGIAGFTDFSDVTLTTSVTPIPELEPGVPVTELSGATGDRLIYRFNVPEAMLSMTVSMAGGSGDADLYVYQGDPVEGEFLCRPFLFGNDETCSLSALPAGAYTIEVRGFTAFDAVTLVADYVSAELQNGVPVVLSAENDAELDLTVNVPRRATHLAISLSGGTGDADLYVRYGAEPTLREFDCAPFLDGNEETCFFRRPRQGTNYIKVHGFDSFSDVTLEASYRVRRSSERDR